MPSTPSLMDQLTAHVMHGDHLRVVRADPQERLRAAAQYIGDRLWRNEFVMYAADAATTQALRAMPASGIGVDHEMGRGALDLPDPYDACLMEGRFDPDAMFIAFETAIQAALDAGNAGCRFAGEPMWALERARQQRRTGPAHAGHPRRHHRAQGKIDANRHAFSMAVPDPPVMLDGDTTRLAQVFLNVLSNAVKSTPPQGRIDLCAEVGGAMARVSIRDNGTGLDPALVPKMFDMFVQGHRTKRRPGCRRWPCSTSACRAWTATRSPGACAPWRPHEPARPTRDAGHWRYG